MQLFAERNSKEYFFRIIAQLLSLSLITLSSVALVVILLLFIVKQILLRRKEAISKRYGNVVHVGFFHPFCNAGGGGERVLWCAIRALQAKYDNVKVVVYTGDNDATPKDILDKVEKVFNIHLDKDDITFVYLKCRSFVKPEHYRYFTLLCQSIGSMVLGMESLYRFPPNIYIETMGFAFTLPIFRYIGKCQVGCYVHYPTISMDMLRRVKQREYSHNNRSYVVKNPFLTWLKLIYYRIFAKLYSLVGRCAETIMVNSTWTENHILDLWDAPFKTHRVYPPCEVSNVKKIRRDDNMQNGVTILSVGQFRPEKNHPLQLQAMYELRTLLSRNEEAWNKTRLIIVGSCRDTEDYERLKNMQDLAKHLSLENNVEFKVNVSYTELLELYKKANIGIHTMWNEHFGIGIVECMAAGLIMVAHQSGGPLMDIIETSNGSQNGYLATDALAYANCIMNIICNTRQENDQIRMAARSSVERFSESEFEVNFLRAISPLFLKDI